MNLYNDVANVANDVLYELGQSVTLSTVTVGAYNPLTGSAATSATTQTGSAVLLEYPRNTNGVNQINGTLLQMGDKRLLLSAVGITPPQLDDSVTASGKTYTIKNIKETNPAGTAVLYDCLVRR